MSVEIVVKCDRCGKTRDVESSEITVNGLIYADDRRYGKRLHLCSGCTKDFDVWRSEYQSPPEEKF